VLFFFVLFSFVLLGGQMQNAAARDGGTQLILTKSVDDDITSAKVGDIIFFRIRFACSSLTIDCGDVEIVDALPTNPNPPNNPLLTYVEALSSVPAGFHMNESPAGTLTITKDDQMLLDGSQYDAVIAARVNYETRPLPATVDNEASGRIKPPGATDWTTPVTSTTPNITIEAPVADWSLSKSLYSPSIQPTVDTDVTYRINLCPDTTEGNVALTDITITDTLPTHPTIPGLRPDFISASNGGTYDSGTGVVTWNIPGPITPPACATRYITMRFDSADGWAVGNTLTNTAAATGDYLDANGNPCPDCVSTGSVPLTHNIIAIVETPTYSKDDVGDPVGIDGTARFTLSLNTNGTNYPANAVVMTDTLTDGELQVVGVTSGTWALDDHVRATIQYATNYDPTPPNWTSFPSQPVDYNDNALYESGLPTNITRVRWVFEYDSDPDDLDGNGSVDTLPGLPFDWSFASVPQIRVIPRKVATTSSDSVAMSVATPGNTYNNCLQVSRVDSSGTPTTGACNIEDMTVEGNFVSLRTTKAETPGYGYDPVADPNIDTFTDDDSILPNDTVKYTLTVEVTERSSVDLVNPVIQDTLPAELVFVRNGEAKLDGVVLATQPHFYPNGSTLTWAWTDNSIPPGITVPPDTSLTVPAEDYGSHYLTVEFYGYVKPGTAPADYTNTLYVATDTGDVHCEVGVSSADGSDLDNDGNTTENRCQNTDTFKVERSAALRGEKWIRSISPDNFVVVNKDTYAPDGACPNGGTVGLTNIPTNSFTRYPCISQAFPEGGLKPNEYAPPPTNPDIDDFEYNLRIFNEGNVPMLEYTLYDILPYSGDKGSGGTLVNQSRLSQFRPTLTGPVTFISGSGLNAADFLIEYSASTNPCRPEVFDKDPALYPNTPAGCVNDWMNAAAVAALPGKWTDVRAYRIELISGSMPQAVLAGDELRFGVPMHIPADMPTLGVVDNDDAQSKEIAWNSYSHVGSYDKDEGAPVVIQDLLASEPRKVGVTVPERFSIGNRVWRDSDNSGDINAPDDTNPGIAGVTVNLYSASDTSTVLDTITTDSGGYYLFSNLPAGDYVVGIPASNFAAGQPLEGLHSSTGAGAIPPADYTNPPDSTPDMEDHGIDTTAAPLPSTEVFSNTITLSANAEQTNETDLSANDRDGIAGARRGVNGERDYNSDLTVDFGFFGGSDVPFSIGNFVWKDDGANGGIINNGIFEDTKEVGAAGVLVNLYRDGDLNGPDADELIRTDITDANGFYLFDNLDPGKYYVQVDKTNFQSGGVLEGWYSSVPTGTELTYVTGNDSVHTPNTDSDDNGIDKLKPEVDGITSGMIELERGTDEALTEAHLSGDSVNPGDMTFSPTGWDGPNSRGRFGETDATSNLTIDFGFIPPMSLGNRVWIDDGAGEPTFRSQYNNGIMDGTEVGKAGVTVELWLDDGNGTLGAEDTLMYTDITDASGYYLFERLQSGENYFVHIPSTNFDASGDPLYRYISSYDGVQTTPPADDVEDKDDNGLDNGNTPATKGITSSLIAMQYNTETEADDDLGTDGAGTLGQEDNDSNLTVDFGFVQPPRSLGNRVWYDPNNNGQIDAGDDFDSGTAGDQPGIPNVTVSLYRDNNGNGIPDDVNADGFFTAADAIAYDVTDANGYYLFDNLPPERYLVAVDGDNFNDSGVGDLYTSLVEYASSTNTNAADNRDKGLDRALPGDATASPYGIISAVVDLRIAASIPTGETALSSDSNTTLGFDPTAGDGTGHLGRFGETDATSNMRIDFGFYKPMSLGNRVFYDNGGTTGTLNNGVMDGDEAPISGVRVELYRDNGNGVFGVGDTLVKWDTTDADGYYLFDQLTPANYFVRLPASDFTGSAPLVGWYSSSTTFADNADVNDNGVDNKHPDANGITSNLINLAWDSAPTGEAQLSADTGYAIGNNPTVDDGPLSRGRFGESDDNSNLTVDFGFIPPLSLGNRVWLDNGDTLTGLNLAQFNNGVMDGTEVGIANVTVSLYYDANDDGVIDATIVDGVAETTPYRTDITDASGYYLFDGLPQGRFFVKVDSANFGAAQPLEGLVTSTGVFDNETGDLNDNGIDSATYLADGIGSREFVLNYTGEPTGETDLSSDLSATAGFNPTAGDGLGAIGRYGEVDSSSNLTADFGFMSPRSLGNRIWLDDGGTTGTPNNGVMDGDEAGIAGVAVSLYMDANADGVPDSVTPLLTDTTDANGYYLFSNFPAGTYIVGVDSSNFTSALQYMASSTDAAGHPLDADADQNDHGIDSTEPAAATYGILSPSIDLTNPPSEVTGETDLSLNPADGNAGEYRGTHNEADNESDLTVDFGFYYPFSLGNRVWKDTGAGANLNNGVMDGDETPIQNVRVELYVDDDGTPGLDVTTDSLLRYDLTDADGYYLFDGLAAGDYYVHIPASNFNNSGDPLYGLYNSSPTFADDADVNDNGVNDYHPEVNGISSGMVTLSQDAEPAGETQLSADTTSVAGNNPTEDDGANARGRYGEKDANSNLTVDFGFVTPLSLGNRVWLDSGSTAGGIVLSQFDDGAMNGDEPGLGGVTLNLYFDANNDGDYLDTDASGVDETAPYASTTTDASGYYLFDNLPAGRYYVQVDSSNFTAALNGLMSSSGVTDDETADKNDNGQDSLTYLADGIRSMDFVLTHSAEPTDESDLSADTAAYGTDNVGLFGQSNGDSNLTLDFGFIALPRSVGNRLWYDVGDGTAATLADFNNGVMDASEAPVVGARVSIYQDTNNDGQPDGAALAFDITDANGFYLFDNLPPARYVIGVDTSNFQSGGQLFEYSSSTTTVDNAANDTDLLDNGVDRILPGDATASPYGILSASIDLSAPAPTGETNLSNNAADGAPDYRGNNGETDANSDLTIDFGFYKPMSLGNRVWKDNGAGAHYNNGVMDADETPISGARVELYLDDGDGALSAGDTLIGHDVTDANGYYLFDGLKPGSYFALVAASNFTSGNSLFGMNSSVPTFADNVDVNDNGVDDARPDLNGIVSDEIVLELNNEPTGETQLSGETDPGAPANSATNPAGWDGVDSRGRYGESDNNSNLTVDFGFLPVYSLGNRVWYDTGNTTGVALNGVMDGDELGAGGVTVNLYLDANNDGAPDGASIGSVATDANGYYRFDNLFANTYIVEVTPPSGYASTVDANQDPDDNVDLDDNGVINLINGDIRSKPITLGDAAEPTGEESAPNPDSADGEAPDDQSNRTVDFGLMQAVAIGNVVWKDMGAGANYNNGILDADENGEDGVTVELYYDANNDGSFTGVELTPYLTTTTAGGGFYDFDHLVPGRYYVQIPAAEFNAGGHFEDYTSSTDSIPATTDQTLDNDVDENGQDVASATLAANGIRSIDYVLMPGSMPTGEGQSNYLGSLPDASVNFTADFGFTQSVALGNRVWFDTGTGGGIPDNGVQDGGELGAPNVTVELYRSGDAIGSPFKTTTTDASGNYVFDGLQPGDYFVHIPAAEFQSGGDLFAYSSSSGQGADETSDQDADENGSDSEPAVNGVSSPLYTLSLHGETTTDNQTSYSGVLDDDSVNFTADFGFTALVALGNRVWLDANNNGAFDVGELGAQNVTVHLYYDADNDGSFTGAELTPYLTDTTDASGYYQFDNLAPGNYYVGIPASEFTGAGALVGYTSSTGSGISESVDDATDENGQDTTTLTSDGIISIPYTLTPGAMPTDDNQISYTGVLDDFNVNFTADFGFVDAYSLGNRVWFDQDKDGLQNGTEPGMSGVTVNLYQDGNPVIYMTTTTDANGYYRFDSLPAGDYVVEVVPPAGYASTIDAGDPDTDEDDNDDNGVFFVGSNVRSPAVTLGGVPEPTGETNPATNPELDGESPDARSNRTVDFGFILSSVESQKQLTATTIMDTDAGGAVVPGVDFTTTPNVAIGEILTYTATLTVPSAATLTNLTALDQLDAGLAFVDCVSISAPDLTTTGSFANACSNPTVAPQSIPDGYTDAAQITFNLGDVSNLTAATQPLVITYRAIVLDVPSNVDGVSGLNNSIQWTWGGGGSAPMEATPVQVIEPDLNIDKRVSTQTAEYGQRIRFTIDIAHTTQSSADAFDVVMQDVVPSAFTVDAASITVTGTASTPGNFTTNFDALTGDLSVQWNSFPLGARARVTFTAVFVGPAPAINSANVAWTSLPIDPQVGGTPERLSAYNDYSTERWYDPLDAANVNAYLRFDTVRLNLPQEDPNGLPTTGFAPNVITPLPLMPVDFAYAQTTLKLEIPKLRVNIPIVGVDYSSADRNWNITWLDRNAGWLEKTAFPTHNGNSVLTAHSILANGLEGPFAKLDALQYGDQIIINLDGQKYIYEVRETKRVRPWEVNAALKHEETAWLTLIGCQEYDETMKEYRYRYLVRAVLVKVE